MHYAIKNREQCLARVLDCLNAAVRTDQDSMNEMFQVYVRAVDRLAQDPNIAVAVMSRSEQPVAILTVLSLLNGVLGSLNLPLVRAVWKREDTDNATGGEALQGFAGFGPDGRVPKKAVKKRTVAELAGCSQETLDDLVYDEMHATAEKLKSCGRQAQLEFLVGGSYAAEAAKLLTGREGPVEEEAEEEDEGFVAAGVMASTAQKQAMIKALPAEEIEAIRQKIGALPSPKFPDESDMELCPLRENLLRVLIQVVKKYGDHSRDTTLAIAKGLFVGYGIEDGIRLSQLHDDLPIHGLTSAGDIQFNIDLRVEQLAAPCLCITLLPFVGTTPMPAGSLIRVYGDRWTFERLPKEVVDDE